MSQSDNSRSDMQSDDDNIAASRRASETSEASLKRKRNGSDSEEDSQSPTKRVYMGDVPGALRSTIEEQEITAHSDEDEIPASYEVNGVRYELDQTKWPELKKAGGEIHDGVYYPPEDVEQQGVATPRPTDRYNPFPGSINSPVHPQLLQSELPVPNPNVDPLMKVLKENVFSFWADTYREHRNPNTGLCDGEHIGKPGVSIHGSNIGLPPLYEKPSGSASYLTWKVAEAVGVKPEETVSFLHIGILHKGYWLEKIPKPNSEHQPIHEATEQNAAKIANAMVMNLALISDTFGNWTNLDTIRINFNTAYWFDNTFGPTRTKEWEAYRSDIFKNLAFGLRGLSHKAKKVIAERPGGLSDQHKEEWKAVQAAANESCGGGSKEAQEALSMAAGTAPPKSWMKFPTEFWYKKYGPQAQSGSQAAVAPAAT